MTWVQCMGNEWNAFVQSRFLPFFHHLLFQKELGGAACTVRERDRKTGLPDFKSLTLLLTKSASPLFTTLFRPVRVFWNNYSLHISTLLSMVWSYSRGRAMRILHNDQCHFSHTYVYATLWLMKIFCSTKVWTSMNTFEHVWTCLNELRKSFWFCHRVY